MIRFAPRCPHRWAIDRPPSTNVERSGSVRLGYAALEQWSGGLLVAQPSLICPVLLAAAVLHIAIPSVMVSEVQPGCHTKDSP